MKSLLRICFFIAALTGQGKTQNYLNIGASRGRFYSTELNKSIEAFNYSRPWLTGELKPLKNISGLSLSHTGIWRKGLFISPGLVYSRIRSEAGNSHFDTRVDIHISRLNVAFDIFPLEFNLDTVNYFIRPFLRLGVSGVSVIPRIIFNDSTATIRDLEYKPFLWTWQYEAGLGCHFRINKIFSIVPLIQYQSSPHFKVGNFGKALNGSSRPELSDQTRLRAVQFWLNLSFRTGLSRNKKKEKYI